MAERYRQNYEIKKPIKRWYAIGIFAAVIVPVLWGIINAWPLVQYILRGCDGMRSGNCWGPNYFVRNRQLMIPIYLTFIFGTLFSAFLGALTVRRKIYQITRAISFGVIGLKSATWAHLLAAIIHVIYLLVEYGPQVSPENKNYSQFSDTAIILMASIPIHLLFWAFITLPLGFICGLVFKTIAVIEFDVSN